MILKTKTVNCHFPNDGMPEAVNNKFTLPLNSVKATSPSCLAVGTIEL